MLGFFRVLLCSAALTGLSASFSALAQTDSDGIDAAAPAPAKTDATDAKPVKTETKFKDYTILRLNGEDIKASEAEELWKTLFPGNNAPDFNTFDESIRQNVLRGMISEKLIYQEALKAGFDKSPEVQKRLENLKKQVILQTFMESKSKTLVTDEQLRKLYAEKVAERKDEDEVHARHILVKDEADAKAIVKELKKGADFEQVAKDKSLDKGSGAQGGDLGYFTKDKMVPEFADAAFKLKPGEISQPVKTSFGWHIIKVEDKRKVHVPTFEEMKDELQGELSNKVVQDYVEGLLKKADIKYYSPEGKEKTFSRSLQPKAQ